MTVKPWTNVLLFAEAARGTQRNMSAALTKRLANLLTLDLKVARTVTIHRKFSELDFHSRVI